MHALRSTDRPTDVPAGVIDWPARVRTDAAAARAFIERRYAQAHAADIACDYRELVAVEDERGRCRAAAGFRRPDERFFLEHYLDADAGAILSEVYGLHVPRASIVEIGNLAADGAHATFVLLQGLLHHLVEDGYEHVLLTCTPRLRRWFRDLPHVRLADADPERVPDAARWGRYYEHAPEVITGRLRDYDQRFAALAGRGGLAFRVVPPAPVMTPWREAS